ncbi:MAG: thermonuclease family protein [Bacteroidota bacterium]|nr:thermonuclease family protein [Bacteroidota bacterium]
MKAKTLFVPLIFVLLTSALAAQDSARVILVKDANTYVLRIGKKKPFSARLLKADGPDMKQFWGRNAYSRIYQMITGKVIQFDSVGKDSRKRVLINAWFQGKRLDSTFISNGWAWHDTTNDHEAMLDNEMNQASANHVGLWVCGANKVCPPWLWRTYKAKDRTKYCKGCN